MERLTLPDHNAALARCPHCNAEVKMETVWYSRLQAIVQALNALMP